MLASFLSGLEFDFYLEIVFIVCLRAVVPIARRVSLVVSPLFFWSQTFPDFAFFMLGRWALIPTARRVRLRCLFMFL